MDGFSLRVSVPASTANLGPGFDAIGLALDLFNVFEVEAGGSGLRVEIAGEGVGMDRSQNLVLKAMEHAFSAVGRPLPDLRLRMVNRIPMARGLGSSASAAVGGLVLANAMLDGPWSEDQLLEMAVEIEGHPDNVAPALWGGLVLSCGGAGCPRYLQLEAPSELHLVVVVPEYPLPTSRARQVLPGQVPFADAVFNVSRAALLVGALTSRRYDLLREAMRDRLHQPYRSQLIPGLGEALEAAYGAGALGAALSGSGPSLLAFATGESGPIAEAMQAALSAHGVPSAWLLARPTRWGALATFHRRH